jgi:hypothetical protein
MRHCLIICAMLLASCGPDLPRATIPPELLEQCEGWQGPIITEGDFVDAAAAEKRGRLICNARIAAIGEIAN